ncbi:unnamed protein product, partial [Oncorhynchus mykiss]
MANWGQNFAPYLGGVNVSDSRSQTQTAFSKQQICEGPPPLQPQQPQSPSRAAEKQPPQPQQVVNPLPAVGEAYRDVRDVAKPPSLEWEQQHQASQQQQQSQTQSFPQTLKPGALNAQQHSTSNPGSSSVLQPFQLAFGQPKQHLTAGYYQVFQGGNRTLPNLNYNSQQPKPNHIHRPNSIHSSSRSCNRPNSIHSSSRSCNRPNSIHSSSSSCNRPNSIHSSSSS